MGGLGFINVHVCAGWAAMIKTRLLIAAGLLAVTAGTASAGETGTWAGPYAGVAPVAGWGNVTYVFNTNGYYNLAAGDTFSHGVNGYPVSIALGYDWQTGHFVYGVETAIISGFGGISNYGAPSPYFGSDRFELKYHWAAATTAVLGVATDRLLFYVQGGAVFGHLIAEARDEVSDYYIRTGNWLVGLTGGVGVEFALSHGISLTAGYRFMAFPAFTVAGESIDRATMSSAGPATATDHTVRYFAQMVSLGVNYRFGMPDLNANGMTFDWAGPYFGFGGGAPRQFTALAGYNVVFGGNFVAGVEGTVNYIICCGLGFTTDVSTRVGYTPNGEILFYGEGGIRYRAGSGLYYTLGGGMEVAVGPRTTGFMELAKIGMFGGPGFTETTFRGGVTFHPF
jgi:outer membrane immunogenic protein